MKDIERKAHETYLKNLSFLSEHDPGLFQKIGAYEQAVEKGYYDPTYELEYLDEGYFDLKERKSGRFLYGMDGTEYAKIAAESVDYKKTGNLFETFKHLNFSDDLLEEIEKMGVEESTFVTVASIIRYANKNFPTDKTTMKKLYKYIFMGTGLGTHILSIHEKIRSNVYFVVEENLEIFHFSLFVTDYSKLTEHGAKVIFSIFDDEREFYFKTEKFLHEMFIYNQYIKFHLFYRSSPEKLQKIQSIIVGQDYLKFPHDAVLTMHLRGFEQLKKGYKFIDLNRVRDSGYFQKKPILILGAGPSFEKNLEWVKENRHRFVIMAVTAIMSTLERESIEPDILLHVDGFEPSMGHLNKVRSIDFFKNSLALFSTFTYPEFAAKFPKENVYMVQPVEGIKEGFVQISASNVGLVGLAYSLYLKAERVYLLGLDLAFDPDTGASHGKDHLQASKVDIDSSRPKLGEVVDYRQSIFEAEGNFREKVPVNPYFFSAKQEAEGIITILRDDDIMVYNMSDGVKISGTEPKSIDRVEEISFSKTEKDRQMLKMLFEESSEVGLTRREKENIAERIRHAENILSILKTFKAKKYSSLDLFHYDLLGVFIDILTEDRDVAGQDTNNVITLYLKFISGYMFDMINTREMQNPKKHIKFIKNEFSDQLGRIVEYYKKYLEDFLEKLPE